MQLPLPSYSTLCRKIQNVDFTPGLLKDVVSLMKEKKKSHTSEHESDCVILMDEMEIQPALEFDVGTGKYIQTSKLIL